MSQDPAADAAAPEPPPAALRAELSPGAARAKSGNPAPLNLGAARGMLENRAFLQPAAAGAAAKEPDPADGPASPTSPPSRRGSIAVSAMLKQGKAEGEEIDLF